MKDKIDPLLWAEVQKDSLAEALLVFRQQAEVVQGLYLPGKEAKGSYVFEKLRSQALQSQGSVMESLEKQNVPFRSLYIVNVIYLPKASASLLESLAKREEIGEIVANSALTAPNFQPESEDLRLRLGVEWGVAKIKAPEVWALGYTGQGVVIGGQDTGYDWKHPALIRKYRGWMRDSVANHAYNWFDAIKSYSPQNPDTVNSCGLNAVSPCDDSQHGTHTMGTMVGDDGKGNQTGVAPGALWIGCRNMERGIGSPFTYLECFQWFLAPTTPDGKKPDPSLAPDVINNSWYCPSIEGCNPSNIPLLEKAVQNLRAAGVFVTVSAGNSGPNCETINDTPASFPASFDVGATQGNDTIARFSSRGPVFYNGALFLKPDVVAPGVNVRSTAPGGGYANFSGTSMAGPHVAGAVALMISANPRLRGEVLKLENLLKTTATPLYSKDTCGGIRGDSLPNPVYGYGRIDALAAVKAAREVVTDTQPGNASVSLRVFPNPASDLITLETGTFQGAGQFSLWDASGRLHVTRSFQPGVEPFLSIRLPRLASGVYFYRWKTGEQNYTGRIAIQPQE
ncbi:MAG: S8 family serine peptidase [Haliscomenobacter sp.]|nr:S8 family serine peptidase [Haliscomenobacter sp.]